MNIFLNKWTTVGISSLACVYSCVSANNNSSKKPGSTNDKPNIIVILADDAGYADFGFMGSKEMETPHIDQLANDGIIFTDAHVSATVCAPSRAGLLTGRYQQRFGFECNIPPKGEGIAVDEKTIGNVLKMAGYKTIVIGKWHVGQTEEYHPNKRGFDEFYGFLGGSRSYWLNEKTDVEGNPHAILHNYEHVDFDGYLTDVFGDKTVEYIEQYKNNPFFIFLSFNAVHTPMHAKEEHLEKYKDHPRKKLAAMTWSMDENIGKVVDKLKAEGLYENTLIFFFSDNGGALSNTASCEPLKGWKGNKFEGGHRIPFTFTWKDKFQGGKKFDGLTSVFDVFVTSMKAAGIDETNGKPLDGVDLLPYMTGEKTGNPQQKLYWRKDQMAGMRDGDYKLVRLEDYGYTMYNLSTDLGETNTLVEVNDSMFNSMKKDLEDWEGEIMEPKWLEDENWSKVTYEIHKALMENRKPAYTNPGQMRRVLKKQQEKEE